MRKPAELDTRINEHRKAHGEPRLIMLRDYFVHTNQHFFSGNLHQLCCGKGALYRGIPAIVTSSAMVEDYLVCY